MAPENTASIAALMLTTEALVGDISEEGQRGPEQAMAAWTGCTEAHQVLERNVGVFRSSKKGEHMGDSDLRYPQWQEPLLRAVMEINPARQTERIGIAETAISSRQGQLAGSRGTGEENIALHDGISTLQSLKRVLLTRRPGL
jgi:hypothetical protein